VKSPTGPAEGCPAGRAKRARTSSRESAESTKDAASTAMPATAPRRWQTSPASIGPTKNIAA
jgi:hypothetical protein